jgi:methyl-accepting chemotaxis protein
MNFFRNLKLANKLLVSFVLILLISAVSGLYGLVQMERVNATATDLARQWLPAARNLQDMRYQLQRYRSQTMQHVMAQSSEEMAVYDKSMPKLWDELVQNQQSYAKYVRTDKERALLAEIGEELKAYAVQTAKVVDLSHQLLNDDASEILRGESLKISRGINTSGCAQRDQPSGDRGNQSGRRRPVCRCPLVGDGAAAGLHRHRRGAGGADRTLHLASFAVGRSAGAVRGRWRSERQHHRAKPR